MKKWLIFCLAIRVLANALPGNFTAFVFKLAYFQEHYHHHQGESGHHGFFHFLADHYFGAHHEEDHQNHENLPFHNHHPEPLVSLQQVPCTLPPTQVIATFAKSEWVETPLWARNRLWFPTQYSDDIWQPPKC